MRYRSDYSDRYQRTLAKREAIFNDIVSEGLIDRGANPGDYLGYDWEIQTPAGPLSLSVHDTWVAGRFEAVEPAIAYFVRDPHAGPTPHKYSGKWNFHFGPRFKSQKDARRAAKEYLFNLDRLLVIPVSPSNA